MIGGLLLLAGPMLRAGDDPKEIVRRALQLNSRNQEAQRNYTYLEREEQRTLDGSGAVKKRESKTWDITQLAGSQYRRLIQINDRPLTAKEQQEEDAKRKKREAGQAALTPEERQKRREEREASRKKQQEEYSQALDGFDFRIAGEEAIDGVPVWVVEGTPRPGYQPKSKKTAFLTKIRGRIWVAKTDYQPVKVDAETIDTISFGGILARIQKGTHIHIEYTRVNDEVWLPKRMSFTASARILLVKGFHLDGDSTYSNYKKFTTDSRVVTTEQLR